MSLLPLPVNTPVKCCVCFQRAAFGIMPARVSTCLDHLSQAAAAANAR